MFDRIDPRGGANRMSLRSGPYTTVMARRPSRTPKARPLAPDALDATWRLFLAVPLSDDVQALVAAEIASLAAGGWPVRWVQPETAHLTLEFLGETTPERAELLRLALPAVVARHAPFDLRTAARGVFPNFRRPRVLWLGLHGPLHRLASLHQDMVKTLIGLDFPSAEEPYHPHITLGRVRNGDGERVKLRDLPQAVKAHFVDAASGAAVSPQPRPVPVREVLLMRSHLGQGPVHHEKIAAFPLGGPEP
jgi:2'-5' RNA ligase